MVCSAHCLLKLDFSTLNTQELLQGSLFKKPKAGLGRKKDDTSPEDDDIALNTHPRRRRKKKGDSSSDSSSDDDEFSSDMHKINRKKERKLRKDLTVAVNTPLTLGLKYLITEDPARSQAYEKAVLLRAIKPRSTNIQQILKNDKLIEWDHPLLNAVIRVMFQHQIDQLKTRRKTAVASKLESDLEALLKFLAEDELLLNPPAVYAIFNSLFTKHPEYVHIRSMYTAERTQFLAEQQNRSKSITRLTGICIGYNFKMNGCENTSCQYAHRCVFHNDKIQHPSMQCSENPNRWKKNEINKWNNANNSNQNPNNSRSPRRRRDRGGYWGRGRGFQPGFHPDWRDYNARGNFAPPNNEYPNAQRAFGQNNKNGNKERFHQNQHK